MSATPETPPMIPKAQPTQKSVFTQSLCARVLHGYAIFLPPLLLAESANSNAATLIPLPVIGISALACGMAIGTFADRTISVRLGMRVGTQLSLLFLSIGLMSVGASVSDEWLVISAFVLGLGVRSAWSSLAEIARRSLATTNRWNGMLWWMAALVFGIALAVQTPWLPSWSIYLAALLAFGLFLQAVTLHHVLAEPQRESSPAAEMPSQPPDRLSETDNSTDECESTECCGGAKPAVPTAFWHGALLGAFGWFVLMGPTRNLFETVWFQNSLQGGVLASGLIAGFLLMFSTAPRTGYAVAIFPFLLLSLFVTVLRWGSEPGMYSPWLRFISAVAYGGVVCGCSSMIGELFSDCPTDSTRTRVVTVSLFAASILLLCDAVLQSTTSHEIGKVVIPVTVFAVAILAVRALPSPVISSLGIDLPPDSDDAEVQDVLAAINK